MYAKWMIMRRLYRVILLLACGLWSAGLVVARPLSPDSLAFRRALNQRKWSVDAFKEGQSVAAQDSLIAAYETFMRLRRYDWASMCLYERAIEYMNLDDLVSMEQLLADLRSLADIVPPSDPSVWEQETTAQMDVIVYYNYYSVASAYYSHLDSAAQAIDYGAQAIVWLERIPNVRDWLIIPVWSYYNEALFYDLYFDPPLTDSIEHYLARADRSLALLWDESARQEAQISLLDLRAWLFYYKHDYRHAKQAMEQVLVLIDSVAETSPNTVIAERSEAYVFMVTLCAGQGRFEEALRWQQLLTENNAVRYNSDKMQALQEVETRYEVEKQKLQLDRLTAHNLAFRRLLYFLVSLLLSAVLIGVVLYLRKKNVEARLYESALEADDMRTALRDMSSRADVAPMRVLQADIIRSVQQLPATNAYRESVLANLQALDLEALGNLIAKAERLTTMDKRYILCFAANMTVEQLADLFHVEAASVYTVRYRLRKKFPPESHFPY